MCRTIPSIDRRKERPSSRHADPWGTRRRLYHRGRRRTDTTHVTGRGESHREVVPAQQGRGTGRHYLPSPQEVRHAYDQHMQRHATPAPLPVPIEASGRSDDTEARTVPQLAAKLPAHQSSSGHGQDRRPVNTYQTAGRNGRPRRYPRLPIRVPQRAQQRSPGAVPRRTHKIEHQPTGMHRSGILRRRQSLREGLAPGPSAEDAPGPSKSSWKDVGPQRGRPQQACRKGQRSHHCCSTSTPATSRQTRTSLNARVIGYFARLVRKVENRCPSPEKHGRTFRDRRSPKKEVRQLSGSHLPRRHHSLARRSQIFGSHARFPDKLGSTHTPRARPRTSDVGNPLSDDGGTREARSLA
ncbi:hypothetical protein Trydic_g10032 [Trypoxylus dichotomus]